MVESLSSHFLYQGQPEREEISTTGLATTGRGPVSKGEYFLTCTKTPTKPARSYFRQKKT